MDASGLVGKRIEIPVHYDMWMRGARLGLVTSYRAGRAGQSDFVFVKLDNPQVTRPLKLWRADWEYVKVLR